MECMTPVDPGTTLLDVVRWRIEHEPNRLAFRFLGRDGSETSTLKYAELGNRINSVATGLANLADPGDRVLILLPPGPDYVAAFFGCLTAGMIAVTAYPPSRSRKQGRLQAIVMDSAPSVAVASERTAALAAGQLGTLDRSGADMRWLIIECLPGGQPGWVLDRTRPRGRGVGARLGRGRLQGPLHHRLERPGRARRQIDAVNVFCCDRRGRIGQRAGGSEAAYKAQLEAADDREAARAEIEQRLDAARSPFRTAEHFSVEEIIDPRDTRPLLCDWAERAHELVRHDLLLGPRARGLRP